MISSFSISWLEQFLPGRLLAVVLIVGSGSLLSAAEFTSYTEPSRNIDISAPEPGVVEEVIVREGQSVQSGDILVKLDARVIEREADIARAELKFKQHRLDKLEELKKKKFASTHEIDNAKNDVKITELKLLRAEALIERLTLRSPIDGIVTELRYDVSESVPGANSHVATVVQINPLRVQFNLPTADARKLKISDVVELEFPETKAQRSATVTFVSPVSTAVVNTVRVTMEIAKEGSPLNAGMKCLYRTTEEKP